MTIEADRPGQSTPEVTSALARLREQAATVAVPTPGSTLTIPEAGAPHLSAPTPTTTRPVHAVEAGVEPRRDTRLLRGSDTLAAFGAGIAAVCLTTLLFRVVAPLSGRVGFVVIAYALFIGLLLMLVRMEESGPATRDRVISAVIHSVAVLLLVALVAVIAYTTNRGRSALTHLNFLTQDLTDAGPLSPLSVGGIRHAVLGTLIQITIALSIVIPLGLTCAVFLSEIPGRYSRFVRTIAEAMTALPSIIAGLFIYATAILALGLPKSGFAASLAISVMMLPIIVRAADVVLRLVPGSLKEASLALGAGQWRTVWHVVLPTSRSGLTTAVILGTARGIGETSPVLITAGYTASTNVNPFKGPMVSLPLAAFQQIGSPQPNVQIRGFATAAVLLVIVVVLFVIARTLGGRGPGQLSRRQERARTRASAGDLSRMGGGQLLPAGSLLAPAPTHPSIAGRVAARRSRRGSPPTP